MEQGYSKFQQGKFGINCGADEKKRKLKEYKASIRRTIPEEPDAYWRQIYFLRHKRRVNEIDLAPPNLPESMVHTDRVINLQNNAFNRGQLLQSKIDQDNALLLADIHKIYRRHHEHEHPLMPYMINHNWKERMRNTLRIAIENCHIHQRLQEVKPIVPSPEYYHKWHQQMNQYGLLASRYPPFWNTRLCAPFEAVAWQRSREVPKPVVYLDVEVLGKAIGRIAFELRADLVPMTVENFRSLCTGDRGRSYRCAEINLILDGLFWQGGDGLTSIYGESFPNENFKMKHDSEGILSMVSYGEKTNNSEFRITATALPPMDKKQVAFGKVIMGMPYLKNMGRLARVSERGKPITKIVVTNCGETTIEGLMNLDPPMSLREQTIGKQIDELEVKKKKDADDPRGEFADIPVTRSYTDINAHERVEGQKSNTRANSTGAKTT